MVSTKVSKLPCFFKIPGGQWYLRDWLINQFPPNYQQMSYIEPYGGAGNVLLKKFPSVRDMYNDLNEKTYWLWRHTKEHPDFHGMVSELKYNKETLDWAKYIEWKPNCPISSLATLVKFRYSRGGLGKDFAWSERLRGGIPGDANAFLNFQKGFNLIIRRLQTIEIMNRDGVDLLKGLENTVALVDPPFHLSVRSKGLYEYDDINHNELLNVVKSSKAKILLCGYQNELYSKELKDWTLTVKDLPSNAGQTKKKQRKNYCVWRNF